jgi:membrane protease YdiL (CAAX protease family)
VSEKPPPEDEDEATPESEPSDRESDDSFASTSEVHVVVPKPHVEGKNTAFIVAIALTVSVAVAFHFTLASIQPGMAPLLALGGIYALFALFTVLRFQKKHELELFKLKGGDITIATVVAALLYGLAYVTVTLIMPRGSVRDGWMFHIYLVIGAAFTDKRHYLSAGLLLVGALEEVSWRGIVLDSLEARVGRFNAALVSSALWAVAHVPTLYRLGDPIAGPNPVLIGAAFGCGLVWSYLRYRTDRLAPAVLSHAIFSWAIVEFPLIH